MLMPKGGDPKQPKPPTDPKTPVRSRGLRVPAYIRVSVVSADGCCHRPRTCAPPPPAPRLTGMCVPVLCCHQDPLAKSQFVETDEVEAWRDRLAWDDRVSAPYKPVLVPCVPGQGLPRERPMNSPAREWGQMSARQAHRSSAGWGCGVGSMLPKQAAPAPSLRAQYHPPPSFRPPSSRRRIRQEPRCGQRVRGSQPTRGNSSLLWGENGRDDCNAANWCSNTTAVHQRDGTPAPMALSRVFVFDNEFVATPESNSYKALTARIEQHHTTIEPPPRSPSSTSHREGSWMSRGHAWNLDRGWRPTSSGALFG